MSMDWNTLINLDPWKYFKLPEEEEQRLRLLFTVKVGPTGMEKLVEGVLLDKSYDDPIGHRDKVVLGIGDAKQMAGVTLFIIGDFIAQYNELGRRYRLPLLPKEIMPFFRYPYHLFQDLNLKNQYKIVKQLNKRFKRGLVIHGI